MRLAAAMLPALIMQTSALMIPLAPRGGAVRLGAPRLAGSPDEDTSSGIQVSLRDPETDRTMECHILQTTSVADAMYASMTPIDTPVAIASLVDGTMVEVDNPLRIDALFPTAQAICAELDLALLQTPVTLTVAGEVDGVEEGDEEEGDVERLGPDLSELDDAEEAEEDEEGVEVISSFQYQDQKYYLVLPLEPFVLVGRQVGGAKFDIPSPGEMESSQVGPELEMLMEQSMAEIDAMEDGGY